MLAAGVPSWHVRAVWAARTCQGGAGGGVSARRHAARVLAAGVPSWHVRAAGVPRWRVRAVWAAHLRLAPCEHAARVRVVRTCPSLPSPRLTPRGHAVSRGDVPAVARQRRASAARADKPLWQCSRIASPSEHIFHRVFFYLSLFSISSKCSHTLDRLLLVIGKFRWHVVPPFGELVVDDLFSRRRIL